MTNTRNTQSATRSRIRLSGSTALAGFAKLVLLGLGGSLALASAHAQSLPTGGTVTAGAATISNGAGTVTIDQSSQATAINWDAFGIAQGNSVTFRQPNAQSVALNRVIGSDPSVILGNLNANGRVFLVNPNGVLFGQGAQVNVGGLVASTLNLTDADFMAGRYNFSGTSGAAVLNRGSITAADGGYVALLGADVSNQGTIVARLGTVALAAGQGVTLDVAGDGLLNVTIDKGAVNALVSNGGMIRADGGHVLLTAQAAGQLLRTVVNNTGVIEARTLDNRNGRIVLLGDMQSGTVNAAGVLDASAPSGGNGGFVETSAATVNIADGIRVTTAAATGATGTWLIDPADFTIAATGGNISGATLSAQLVTNSVVISTLPVPGDNTGGVGDIFVNDAVAWTASGTPTTLTMNGNRDVNINAAITATNGNVVVCCGRDINVNAPITTTNGSVLLNAGRDIFVYHAITTTDGNITLCAGHDVHIDDAVTLTRGSTIPAQSLGLPIGLQLIAGASGVGPGVNGGTIIFAPLAPPTTVTAAPVTINYNPVSYSAPTDFSTNFVLTEGAALSQRMLLFPNGDRVADGTTNAVLSGFNTTATSGLPVGVTLVAGPNATATFAQAEAGTGIAISYSGYTLAGTNAGQYALAGSCCVTTQATTGTISAAPVVVVPPVEVPPVVVPPVEVPPVVVIPPVEVPPVVVPPVEVPPVVVIPPVEVPPVVVVPPVEVPPVVVIPPVEVPPVVVIPPVEVPPVVVIPPVEVPVVVIPPVGVPVVVVPAPVGPATRPLVGIVPAVVGVTALPQLTVVGTGVFVPTAQQVSLLPAPVEQAVVDERPVDRVSPTRQGNAFLPAPVVPVYPRKQARH
jgi:filamentous hemagglutinin family protein